VNAKALASTLSLIPERVARVQTGMAFSAEAMHAFPERMTILTGFLNWLGPLTPLGRDQQHALGLMTAYGKPAVPGIENDAEPHAEEDTLFEEIDADEAVEPMPSADPSVSRTGIAQA